MSTGVYKHVDNGRVRVFVVYGTILHLQMIYLLLSLPYDYTGCNCANEALGVKLSGNRCAQQCDKYSEAIKESRYLFTAENLHTLIELWRVWSPLASMLPVQQASPYREAHPQCASRVVEPYSRSVVGGIYHRQQRLARAL